ncbi:hypothetical protein WICMUC_005768 [Wickerhamomyces mucosus]|uniref:Cyclin N-terminal domain-containing protein n=1 Tax=Wickerhamomyces mucosus TaxID=1378264 RepID=A0A9P8T305_9ASCO|nr:hypothetical protein WICMUC_005768 [Wickerhamomyces mucosus]
MEQLTHQFRISQDENNLNAQVKNSKITTKSNIPVRRGALTNVTNTKLNTSTQDQLNKKPIEIEVTTQEDERSTIKRNASHNELNQVSDQKRSKVKEYERDDLDKEDINDPYMVSEYTTEIYEYLHELELKTLPTPDYLSSQTYIRANMRDQLVDWMCEVHNRFRLLPETLFIAINLVDRFLSREVVQVSKLQLLGSSSLFIASKYEEIYSPSVSNFAHESGDDIESVLSAETFILEVLDFNLSYPNPLNFLRRISKADQYDLDTRTVAKYFLEISIMDEKFIGIRPSLCAAAAMYLSRKIFEKDEWNGNLIYYSGEIFEDEILPVVQLILNYLVGPVKHEEFFKKYAARKFLKASVRTRQWAKSLMRSS